MYSIAASKLNILTSVKQHIMEYVRKFLDNLECVFYVIKLFFH